MLTGKSGIGKSLFAKALCEDNPQIERDILLEDIVYLPQHAEHSFNPLQKIKVHFEDIRQSLRIPKAIFHKELSKYFEMLALPLDCLDLYPFECSGGMLQRIQIALAQCQQPKCIIADEPTSALNEELIQKVFSLWKLASEKGTALFIITHQVKQYEEFANILYEIKNKELHLRQPTFQIDRKNSLFMPKGLLCCKVDGQILRTNKSFWKSTLIPVLTINHFTCYQGEVIGVRGQSGCGKTTLLKALLSDYEIRGDVKLPRVQYVPQLYDESFPMNWRVDRIIREAQKAAKCSQDECINLLNKLQLEPTLLKQRVQTLSGGQRQKLALFRVLLKKPQLLLLDEAFSSLDDESTEQITTILLQFVQESRLSVVCVSHDEAWLNQYTNRQYIVEHNEVKEYTNETTNLTATRFYHSSSL